MEIICQGTTVVPGTAIGCILSVTDVDSALKKTDKNTILLLENSDPIYCLLIMKAGGVIIKEGGSLSHTCLLAMEMGVPCITRVGRKTVIEDGKRVCLDAGAGNVYEC